MRLTSAGALGLGTTTPSATLHVSGTIRIADGGEACDTNRAGAIKYASGTFYFCSGSAWQTIGDLASTQADRITSGTTNVYARQDGSISFTTAGITTGYFYNGQLVASGVSTTGTVSATDLSVANLGGVSGSLVFQDQNGLLRSRSSILISSTTGSLGVGTNPAAGIGNNAISALGQIVAGGLMSAQSFWSSNGKGLHWSGNDSLIGDGASHYIAFITSSTEALRIVSTGYVGIGTTNPTNTLQVSGSILGNTVLATTRVITNNGAVLESYGTSGMLRPVNAGASMNIGTAMNLPAITLTSSSLVGIGTTAPSATLHVSGTALFTSNTAINGTLAVSQTVKLGGLGTESCGTGAAGTVRFVDMGDGLGNRLQICR